MPRASQWLIRTALIHLVVGFGLGAWILAGKGGLGDGSGLRLVPAHADIVLFGWMLQVVMGVASWILPRPADRKPSSVFPWTAWTLLNAGILAGMGSVLGLSSALVAAGRVLEAAAVVVFVAGVARRVRAARVDPPRADPPEPGKRVDAVSAA